MCDGWWFGLRIAIPSGGLRDDRHQFERSPLWRWEERCNFSGIGRCRRHRHVRQTIVVQERSYFCLRVITRARTHHDFGDVALEERLRKFDARFLVAVFDLDLRLLQIVECEKPGLGLMRPSFGLGRYRIPEHLSVHIGGHEMEKLLLVLWLR